MAEACDTFGCDRPAVYEVSWRGDFGVFCAECADVLDRVGDTVVQLPTARSGRNPEGGEG